jgi:FkbM family methyltransferase
MLALGRSRTLPVHWHTIIPALVTPGSHVLDMGGNIGLFSREMSERFDCVCHCVEPDPELLGILPPAPRVRKHSYALAAENGTVEFERAKNRLAGHVRQASGSGVGVATNEVFPVEAIDLETFVARHVDGPIGLLKLDIEGAEYAVLMKAPDDLLQRIPQVTVEIHDFCGIISPIETQQMIDRMQDLGFAYLRMSGIGHHDTLFVNRRFLNWGVSDQIATVGVVRNLRGIKRIAQRALGMKMTS